ncbi:MAG: hypothetical protein IPJ65_26560 [Archangiaceae bacterium]|nr:hypothetical protein [Archangiaceae bacterium]
MVRPLFAVLLLAACGPGVEPPHLLYSQDAQSLSNPFPDSRAPARAEFWKPFMTPKTARQVRTLVDGYTPILQKLEGVGNFAPTLLPTAERLDRSSLKGTLARLQETASGWQVLEADVPVESSRDILDAEMKEVPEGFPEFVLARPTRTLPEGVNGMLVVKKGMRTEAGVALGRGFDLGEEMVARCQTAARALGIDEREVLLALPVTGAPVSARFEKIVAGLDALPPATMTVGTHGRLQRDDGVYLDGKWTSSDTDWLDLAHWTEKHAWTRPAADIGMVLYGTFPSHDLREDGVWKDAWVDAPGTAPAVPLRFVVVVPKGPKPPGGWPFVIAGHGINSRNTTMVGADDSICVEIGQLLARAGIACAGIDAPSHGSRGNPFAFFEIENLAKTRENFRQMAVDQMQLIRAMPGFDVDGDGSGDFRREAGYWGNSLGSIMGASTTSVDPRITTAVLNVPGGGLSNILTGEEIRDRIGLLVVAKTGLTFQSPEYYGLFPFLRTVAQVVLDPGDPVNVGRMLGEKSVLAQEGLGDITIPNFTTEELSVAMGLTAVTAAQVGEKQKLLFRADPKAYLSPEKAQGYNGHGLIWESAAGALRAQGLRFLVTGGREFSPDGTPQ